jgi:hypothetical protein
MVILQVHVERSVLVPSEGHAPVSESSLNFMPSMPKQWLSTAIPDPQPTTNLFDVGIARQLEPSNHVHPPAVKDAGKLELVVMLAVAGLAFAGAPYYVALLGTALLTFSTLQEYAHLQSRFVGAGAARLMASGILLAGVMSFAFASLCFGIGRFFAWLIAS